MEFEKFLETQGLTKLSYDAKTEAEKAVIMSNYLRTIGLSISENKTAFNALETAFNTFKEGVEKDGNFKDSEEFKGVKDELDELKETLDELKEVGFGTDNIKTIDQQLKEFFSNPENQEAIKSAHKNKGEKVTFKVVGTITTANGSYPVTPPPISGTQQAPIQNINLRDTYVLPLTTNLNTSLAAYPYTEASPKDGDYEFVAEGGLKEQIDFNWVTRYAEPVKVAAWIRLTDESINDVVGLESVARDYLLRKHNLKKQKGILFGDGVAPNPQGATVYARTFER